MTHKAPVEHVGGTQSDGGPWPDDVEEIAQDDRLQRSVQTDGTTEMREVVITDIQQFEETGYSVSYYFPGGGSP